MRAIPTHPYLTLILPVEKDDEWALDFLVGRDLKNVTQVFLSKFSSR